MVHCAEAVVCWLEAVHAVEGGGDAGAPAWGMLVYEKGAVGGEKERGGRTRVGAERDGNYAGAEGGGGAGGGSAGVVRGVEPVRGGPPCGLVG